MGQKLFQTVHPFYQNSKLLFDIEKVFLETTKVPFTKSEAEELSQSKKNVKETLDGIDHFFHLPYEVSSEISSVPRVLGVSYHYQKQKFVLDNMQEYFMELSEKYQIMFVFFCLDDLDLEEMFVKGTMILGRNVIETRTAIPPVIYNVSLHGKLSSIKIFNRLKKLNKQLINPIQHYNQSTVFQLLSSLTNCDEFLLPVINKSSNDLMIALKRDKKITLLPEVGLGNARMITIGEVSQGKCKISFDDTDLIVDEKELSQSLTKVCTNSSFRVMKGSSPLHWRTSPLELRVYVQKGEKGHWKLQEVIAKNGIFTRDSIEHGSATLFKEVIKEIFPENPKVILEKISHSTHTICSFLEGYMPEPSSFTLDFVLSQNGHPYLVYVGGWEQTDHLYILDEEQYWVRRINESIQFLEFLIEKNSMGVKRTHDKDRMD
jgi:hypothetical protein